MNGNKNTLDQIGAEFEAIEKQASAAIIDALKNSNPGRDRAACDKIFGTHYTYAYLAPCISKDLASRAAHFASYTLIPIVLEVEKAMTTQFHKGALFYDTALAYLMSGNEDGCEYLMAMADEENVKTSGGARGTLNLRSGGLAGQTIQRRMEFACNLLNGQIAGSPLHFGFLTGLAPLTPPRFDTWRQHLDSFHQFELLRVVHEVEVFAQDYFASYPPVTDNPFVLLRLTKALSHLAQWVESCLTNWQGPTGPGGALAGKLRLDSNFGATLSNAAGSRDRFAGNSPHGAAVDAELRQLLLEIQAAPVGPQKQWRLLRALYIVRNSTAHTIEPTLAMYQDRQLLLNLIQVVFASVFVIGQLKNKTPP